MLAATNACWLSGAMDSTRSGRCRWLLILIQPIYDWIYVRNLVGIYFYSIQYLLFQCVVWHTNGGDEPFFELHSSQFRSIDWLLHDIIRAPFCVVVKRLRMPLTFYVATGVGRNKFPFMLLERNPSIQYFNIWICLFFQVANFIHIFNSSFMSEWFDPCFSLNQLVSRIECYVL